MNGMRVDLDDAAVDLNGLPRFQRAPFQARLLLRLAAWTGVLAAALLLPLLVPRLGRGTDWRPLLAGNGAALLMLSAGLLSAWRVARWRRFANQSRPAATTVRRGRFGKIRAAVWKWCAAEAFWLSGLAIAALLAAWSGFGVRPAAAAFGQAGMAAGGAVVLAAFGLLVLERYFAGLPAAEWPEARALAQLVRVALACLGLTALFLFFADAGRAWLERLPALLGLLPAAVALEFVLRAGLSLFSPLRPGLEPRLLAGSFAAGLLRWQRHPWRSLQDGLHTRFGIDLKQNWAFLQMRRALLPVSASIAAVGWLLSGLHQVPLDGRDVYERFGKPVRVLGPGLHLGLPWPLGRTRPMENGIVHEVAVTAADEASTGTEPTPAEGPAPDSANRLWDASHASENSQVLASVANDRQSFQMVNMDVRLVYRIGLSDPAALAAAYRSADLPALIRSSAGRVLVRGFATRTLDGVLGEQRAALAGDIAAAVQAELDRLGCGVEILAAVIEAIHPPVGAANAYHSVQAAQITAQALVARERGHAAEQANLAQMQASLLRDKAAAAAREVRAGAEAAQLRFAAEQDAYRAAGGAFLLERYLAGLGQGLANARLLIVDHRIGTGNSPVVDLRSFALPVDASASRKGEE
ncbi:MAG: SPFH domain-containing protein [Nevskia sp.]|nr:SPFH domain-containing protein [Nevskia sp.]